MLDVKICQTMGALLEKLTTAGKDILDVKLLKEFLVLSGTSEEYLKVCHDLVMQQLEKDHSQIRYGTLLVIEQLFKRSKRYRELLLDDMETFLELTLETNPEKVLPEPFSMAKMLKQKSLKLIQTWTLDFGGDHRQLMTTNVNVKKLLKVDFNDVLMRSKAEVEAARQKEEAQRKINESIVQALKAEVNENADEISRLVAEMSNCFSLLIPKPNDLFQASDMEEAVVKDSNTENDSSENPESIDLREHGLGLTRSTVTINVSTAEINVVERFEDNEIIFETLKELYSVLKKRIQKKIKRWLNTLSRSDSLELFKRVVNLKLEVEEEMSRYEKLRAEFKILKSEQDSTGITKPVPDSDSDVNDSDFEDVPEKDGFEEHANSPPVKPPSPKPSTSKGSSKPSYSSNRTPESSSWSLWGPVDNDPQDPTTLFASFHGSKIDNQKPSTSKRTMDTKCEPSSSKVNLSRKERLLQQAPKLPYDVDLYHWEEEKLTAPSVELVDSDSHRFWQSTDREGEVVEAPGGASALRTRTIEFTGKFEPVAWTCRVPLQNGKLCQRQDRVKCPFHGKVIGRDEHGNPTNPDDAKAEMTKKVQEEEKKPPEWQDPVFLRDLKAQIGIDLTVKPPKKGRKMKTFSEQYPGLTDLRKEKKTPRARLEKKIFNRNAMKRVGHAMDAVDEKKYRDKFGDQYNYVYNE